MKLRQRICARSGTVQHQTKLFYFVALKFAGIPDLNILIDYVIPYMKHNLKIRVLKPRTSESKQDSNEFEISHTPILILYVKLYLMALGLLTAIIDYKGRQFQDANL